MAIEKLAHAIEYLCDETVLDRGTMFVGDPRIAAVELLASLQRAIYSECPPHLSFWNRMRTFLVNSLVAKPGPEMTSTAAK